MMDFYKDAPYKKQGKVPFGVQHGTFLTTEEKVRRRWREWSSSGASASGSGNGKVGAGSTPSYQELVSSMRVLLGEDSKVDVMDLMKDEAALVEALAAAKSGKIEWVQQQSTLLGGKAQQQEGQYMFRFIEGTPAAAAK